jgi:transmembrane sensor
LVDGSEYYLNSRIRLALVGENYAIRDEAGIHILDNKKGTDTKRKNKLFVPRNGKYDITLCDGTKVWVNSDSELYYPSAFASDQRIVKASGEMYFEVSHHDSWPFIIETDYGRVEVKGTSFNLRSYREEKKLVTTLVQGKVLVSSHETEDIIELHPGETAVVTDNQEIDVVTANVQEVVSWKDDMFVFRSSTLEQIMEEAARWYDIRIVWVSEERRHTLFSGELPRSKDFVDFVRMIELTEKVSFSVKGRTVYID